MPYHICWNFVEIEHHFGMVVPNEFFGFLLKVSSAEGDAVYLGNSVIGIAFTFKMMVFFNYSINISIFNML